MPQGAVVEPYANAGYRLTVVDGEARVRTDLQPLESRAPYAAPRGLAGNGGDPVRRLALTLVNHADTRYDAVGRILGWVSREIRYELDRGAAQTPVEVLQRHSAYCTGVARLSVALLGAAGIEAREVAGWIAADTVGGTPSTYHRWIEVWYPDRGWVFSDPLVSHNWVPANYLRLASDQVEPGGEAGGLLLERIDGVTAVDLYPGSGPRIRARRNEARQLAGSLHVEAEGRRGGIAVLEGEGFRQTTVLSSGGGTFLGLAAGEYSLHVELPGETVLLRRVRMRGRVKSAIFFPPLALGMGVEGQSR
ncbi:MAG: transglutaminase-like domain-containing protein [Acidobacteriota bacterium]